MDFRRLSSRWFRRFEVCHSKIEFAPTLELWAAKPAGEQSNINAHTRIMRDVSRRNCESVDMAIPPAIPTAGANVPSGPQSSAPTVLSRHRLSWLRGCDIPGPVADDRKQARDKYPAHLLRSKLAIRLYPYVFELSAAVRERNAIEVCGRAIGRGGCSSRQVKVVKPSMASIDFGRVVSHGYFDWSARSAQVDDEWLMLQVGGTGTDRGHKSARGVDSHPVAAGSDIFDYQ